MICPSCDEFVMIMGVPEVCPKCAATVRLCKDCFGTGRVETFMTGGPEHGRRSTIECNFCGGRGLLRGSVSS